jgi:DNA-binding NtrC family response regulator
VAFVDAAIRGSDAFHGYLPEGGMDVVGFLQTLEARLIQAALERAGTVAGAARLLGFNRTTLVEKLKRARRDQAATMRTGAVVSFTGASGTG